MASPISALALAAAMELPPPTDEQIAVIEAPLEPVLVVAGAGAGKTETMAARLVWLIANGYVDPDHALGLTFTRKAAQQLGSRIRSRLSFLSTTAALTQWDPSGNLRERLATADPRVSTYHAYAGRLVADFGLLLPIEPGSVLLSETELWQLAFTVVSRWDGPLQTTRSPAGLTQAVLRLHGEMSEHLVTPEALEAAGTEFGGLIDTLPPGPRQRTEPSQTLRTYQAVIAERRQLLPIVAALRAEMAARQALDFGSQMSLAARLVVEHPEVTAAERRAVSAVLLDEYQDTGHAQRILLRGLFGASPGVAQQEPIAVTAVGDPIQSIYGWRGASAANLPRFAADFPRADGSPAHRLELLTSWRNSRSALALANQASVALRSSGVPVSVLRPRDDAPSGEVLLALADTVTAEHTWLADTVAQRYTENTAAAQTFAVLVRRNADAAPIAAALAARGIPTEVVGLGGLLYVPEVADVVAWLRVLADPTNGAAMLRILTGSRWRLGAADLIALWNRARELAGGSRGYAADDGDSVAVLGASLRRAVPGEDIDQPGLGDAVLDPGERHHYSTEGYARIGHLAAQINRLRRRIGQPLADLVAEVERVTGVLLEAQVRAARQAGRVTGREHLDAFAHHVASFAERSQGRLPALLAFLDAAVDIEKGLEPGHVEVADDRVQILTVHAAKGLEWDVVAIACLSHRIFPSGQSDSTWLGSAPELPPGVRGDVALGDGSGSDGYPPIRLHNLADRKDLETAIDDHKHALRKRRLDEDRRLFYVALTRAKHTLLLSGHRWAFGDTRPRGPSEFLTDARDALQIIGREGFGPDAPAPRVQLDWAPEPEGEEENPLAEVVLSKVWPVDPLGTARPAIEAGAASVLKALKKRGGPTLFGVQPNTADPDPDVARWRADAAVLLQQYRDHVPAEVNVALPQHLSVSQLVELRRNKQAFARRLRRPMPVPPNPSARRGTAFHGWVERHYGATRLLESDELPGAADADRDADTALETMREVFLASRWAARTPTEIEFPFELVIADRVIRGRMDAVFADPDGGFTIVDWKTGAPPARPDTAAVVQLAAYRLAWAELTGTALDQVRAAYFYVRSGDTWAPMDLPERAELTELLRVGDDA